MIWVPVVPRHGSLTGHSPSSKPPGGGAASGGGGPGAWVLLWPELGPVSRGGWCVRQGLTQRGTYVGGMVESEPTDMAQEPRTLTQA